MECRLCYWLYKRLCPQGLGSYGFWDQSRDWERAATNEWDSWTKVDNAVRAKVREASDLLATAPSQALELRKQLAESGVVLAMRQLGWQYELGRGVQQDLGLAEHWYYQALLGGSWLATLQLASLLYNFHINERWEGILENGVESDFIPANFWLARYRYDRRPGRRTAREVRPLIERAAKAGHPAARLMFARWKMSGKLGVRLIREGFREYRALVGEYPCDAPTGP